jgi:hypothetical protein
MQAASENRWLQAWSYLVFVSLCACREKFAMPVPSGEAFAAESLIVAQQKVKDKSQQKKCMSLQMANDIFFEGCSC